MTSSLLLLSSIKMSSVPPSPPPPPEASPQNNRLPGSGSLSIRKRSWIVKTESNVWKEEKEKPIPPCVRCGGKAKVTCHYCGGRGRSNCVHLAVLPKGKWPKWCKICGGSGLAYCTRCNGTGEYRESMASQLARYARGQNDQKKNP